MTALSPFEFLLAMLSAIVLGLVVQYYALVRPREQRIEGLVGLSAGLRKNLSELKRDAGAALEQSQQQSEVIETLRRTLVYIPEIARRLAGNLELRQIPGATLDLVEEILEPEFVLFYRATRNNQVVVIERRGDCAYPVGHCVDVGAGVVGWAASSQMAFTEEDAQRESALVKSQNLSKGYPAEGFSICAPLVVRERTLGVILVGPLGRPQPQLRELTRTIALIASVSIERASIFKKQQALANIDGLTGILNKTNILQRAQSFVEEAETGGSERTLSVFMMDIDHFKEFNDSNGHLCGDELLKDICKLLNDQVRESEAVGRFGGEEFLFLMPGASKSEALQAADRFRELVAGSDFACGQRQPSGQVTISGGVANWPIDGQDFETVLRKADEALYEAKRAGRNRIVTYMPPELTSNYESDLEFSVDRLASADKPDLPEFDD